MTIVADLVGVTQSILADPTRGDGHDAHGNPGDCLPACLATILGRNLDDVPHFGLTRSWFARLRIYLRATTPYDAAYWADPAGIIATDLVGIHGCYGIGGGPSPRGPFLHAVVIDLRDGSTVWDPHPSRAGIRDLFDVFALVDPWPFPPELPAICRRAPTEVRIR